jgi:transcriptional regulator with XRE-family HTH domain
VIAQNDRTYDRAVGALLRALRHQYRVKQEQLAERLGVDVATISRYERGERTMSVGTLLQIADQFHVPASTLLPPEHQPKAPESPSTASSPASGVGSLLAGLPQFEAGAIKSIVQVLAARPELIVPVMTAIEQYAESTLAQPE